MDKKATAHLLLEAEKPRIGGVARKQSDRQGDGMNLTTIKAHMERTKARKAKRKDNAKFIRKIQGRPRLPSIKTLQDKLWDLDTRIVRRRDGPLCLTCPVAFPGQPVQPGYAQCHIAPEMEGQAAVWDLSNKYFGCRKCNKYENTYRARWANEIFPKVFTPERLAAIWANARTTVQYRRPDYERMISERKAMLESKPTEGI